MDVHAAAFVIIWETPVLEAANMEMAAYYIFKKLSLETSVWHLHTTMVAAQPHLKPLLHGGMNCPSSMLG